MVEYGNRGMLVTDDNIKRLQATQLEILIEFDRICRKNGLTYHLFCGTLLGAVRHKGFIPWDDDIDVCMRRKDYNKFLELCKKELGPKYFLQTYETDKNFFHSFARIRKNNTFLLQKEYSGIKMHHGIFIDVFPLDNIIEDKMIGRLQYYLCRITRILKNIKLWYRSSKSIVRRIIKEIIIAINKPIPISFYNALETKFATIFQNRETEFSSLLVEDIKLCYEICKVRNSEFLKTCELEFEGHFFLAPANYHEILQNIYGDYMTPPPVSERKWHHNIIDLKFDTDS